MVLWSTCLNGIWALRSITLDLPNFYSDLVRWPTVSISFPYNTSFANLLALKSFAEIKTSFMCFSSTFVWNLHVKTDSFALRKISTSYVLVTFFVSLNIEALCISFSKISLEIVNSFFLSKDETTLTFNLSLKSFT